MKPVPAGEGLVVRRVRLARGDVVLLGAILSGEDHLASIHGEDAASVVCAGRVIVSVLTTASREGELDAWLDELTDSLGLEIVAHDRDRAVGALSEEP